MSQATLATAQNTENDLDVPEEIQLTSPSTQTIGNDLEEIKLKMHSGITIDTSKLDTDEALNKHLKLLEKSIWFLGIFETYKKCLIENERKEKNSKMDYFG